MNNKPSDPQNNNSNSPFANRNAQRIWLIVGVVVLLLFVVIFGAPNGTPKGNTISLDRLAEQIKQGNVTSIEVRGGNDVFVVMRNNTTPAYYYKERETNLFTALQTYGITADQFSRVGYTERQGDNTTGLVFQLLVAIVPTLIIVWLLWRMMRSVRTGQDQAMSFGRSRARVVRDMERPQVTFADVAGADEAKQELAEVVEFLKEPEKFIRLGARIPKGVLMVGPPGTGKTLMARAVAGEAGVPFFSISGSEFVEMFVGVGASRVRDLFNKAKAAAPAIVFIDEIDAVGRQRGAGLGGGNDEREQTLNQMLAEMDGFDQNESVIVMAATNRPDVLDPALLRPGRFDRQVTVALPDRSGRFDILKVHVRGKPLAAEVDLLSVAKVTVGFSGADIANLANEAALTAARHGRKKIGSDDFSEAFERIVLGTQAPPLSNEHERRVTAFHEAGHALTAALTPGADPPYKVTIIPRGQAGGVTVFQPEDDRRLYSKDFLIGMMVVGLGGRAAEEVAIGEISSGASSDLRQVTNIARRMVAQLGMSPSFGLLNFGDEDHQPFLGYSISQGRSYSEETLSKIDAEVRRMVDEAHEQSLSILRNNRDKLEALALELIETESVDRMRVLEIAGVPNKPILQDDTLIDDSTPLTDDSTPLTEPPVTSENGTARPISEQEQPS